jgi:hypothetical protein
MIDENHSQPGAGRWDSAVLVPVAEINVIGNPAASCPTAQGRVQWSAAGYRRRAFSKAWA